MKEPNGLTFISEGLIGKTLWLTKIKPLNFTINKIFFEPTLVVNPSSMGTTLAQFHVSISFENHQLVKLIFERIYRYDSKDLYKPNNEEGELIWKNTVPGFNEKIIQEFKGTYLENIIASESGAAMLRL